MKCEIIQLYIILYKNYVDKDMYYYIIQIFNTVNNYVLYTYCNVRWRETSRHHVTGIVKPTIANVQESSHLDPRDNKPQLQQHVIRGAQRNVRHR
jgi:hypothetical protein